MNTKPVPDVLDMNKIYFEGCAHGELRLRRCLKCHARFRFAHDWCPKCWSNELGWEVASGHGKVSHFSVVHQAPSKAFEADVPYVVALVDLAEGVRMMSNIVGCDPNAVHIGMDVSVSFEERGTISIPMFRPAARQ